MFIAFPKEVSVEFWLGFWFPRTPFFFSGHPTETSTAAARPPENIALMNLRSVVASSQPIAFHSFRHSPLAI